MSFPILQSLPLTSSFHKYTILLPISFLRTFLPLPLPYALLLHPALPFPQYSCFLLQISFLLLFALAFCAFRVSAQDTTCQTVFAANFTAPAGLSKLQIRYPTSLPIKFEYYSSTTGDIDVDVEWCSNDATLIGTLKSLFANITSEVDDVLLRLGLV